MRSHPPRILVVAAHGTDPALVDLLNAEGVDLRWVAAAPEATRLLADIRAGNGRPPDLTIAEAALLDQQSRDELSVLAMRDPRAQLVVLARVEDGAGRDFAVIAGAEVLALPLQAHELSVLRGRLRKARSA